LSSSEKCNYKSTNKEASEIRIFQHAILKTKLKITFKEARFRDKN